MTSAYDDEDDDEKNDGDEETAADGDGDEQIRRREEQQRTVVDGTATETSTSGRDAGGRRRRIGDRPVDDDRQVLDGRQRTWMSVIGGDDGQTEGVKIDVVQTAIDDDSPEDRIDAERVRVGVLISIATDAASGLESVRDARVVVLIGVPRRQRRDDGARRDAVRHGDGVVRRRRKVERRRVIVDVVDVDDDANGAAERCRCSTAAAGVDGDDRQPIDGLLFAVERSPGRDRTVSGVDRKAVCRGVLVEKCVADDVVRRQVAVARRHAADDGPDLLVLGDVERVSSGRHEDRPFVVDIFDVDDDERTSGARRRAAVDGEHLEALDGRRLAVERLFGDDLAALVDPEKRRRLADDRVANGGVESGVQVGRVDLDDASADEVVLGKTRLVDVALEHRSIVVFVCYQHLWVKWPVRERELCSNESVYTVQRS